MTDVRVRRSRSFAEVAFGLVALAAIMGALLTALYFRIVRYQPVAAMHLPPDSELAARLDLQNVVVFDPVRKSLLPLVDDLLPSKTPGLRPRRERLKERAGFELAAELREVVVARGPNPSDWVVVLGGKFPSSGVVPALSEIFSEEGQPWALSPDRKLVTAPNGVTIAQADDGAIVIAASQPRAASALPANRTAERLSLNVDSAVSLSARGGSLAGLLEKLEPRAPEIRRIGRIERVTGELELGQRLHGRIVERLAPGTDVESARKATEGALRSLAKDRLAAGEIAGEGTALQGASATAQAAGIVEVAFAWDRDGSQVAAARLADWVRRRARQSGEPAIPPGASSAPAEPGNNATSP